MSFLLRAELPRRVSQSVFYLLIRVASLLLRLVPRRVALGLGASTGRMLCPLFRSERRVAVNQILLAAKHAPPGSKLALITSQDAAEELTRQVFSHIGRGVIEAFFIRQLTPCVTADGDEVVHNALAAGSGLLALSGHVGCFELLAAYHVSRGVPLTVVGRTPNYAGLSRWLNELRRGYGVETIWRKKSGAVATLSKVLKQHRALAVLIDQDTDLESHYCPFFGIPAAYPIVPLQIALRFKLPVFTSFIVRKEHGVHHVISEPLSLDGGIEQALAEFNQRLEHLIAQHPEQWVWWHRRWRRRPEESRVRSTKEYIDWMIGSRT